MWRALALEPTLTTQVLELLLDKVNRDVPYKENKSFLRGSRSERVATFYPLSVSVRAAAFGRKPLRSLSPPSCMGGGTAVTPAPVFS